MLNFVFEEEGGMNRTDTNTHSFMLMSMTFRYMYGGRSKDNNERRKELKSFTVTDGTKFK